MRTTIFPRFHVVGRIYTYTDVGIMGNPMGNGMEAEVIHARIVQRENCPKHKTLNQGCRNSGLESRVQSLV